MGRASVSHRLAKILLDLDGVLVNFVGGALALHGVPELFSRPESLGVFDIERLLGISSEAFWAPINAIPDFWESLEETPEAPAIVDLAIHLVGKENVGVCTAPAPGEECFLGKRRWVQKRYPWLLERFTLARTKEFYAAPGVALVDDADRNLKAFGAAGGISICVPRPWNHMHRDSTHVMETIQHQFKEVMR